MIDRDRGSSSVYSLFQSHSGAVVEAFVARDPLRMAPANAVDDDLDVTAIALTISKRQNQRCIGAAVHRRLHRGSMDDSVQYSIELFDFLDGEQFAAVRFVSCLACK